MLEAITLRSAVRHPNGEKFATSFADRPEAAVDPAVAGIAAAEIAEAVAMQEAAGHYRHRCLDVGLDQLQWWLEEESAEWAVEEERHLRADYIWQISREARSGAECRVWQQWKAGTGVWKAAATKAKAVNTAGSTEPAVGAMEATAAAASEMEAATAIQAADEVAEDGDWLEVLAAVAMAEATANSRAVAGAVRAENPLFRPMGAEAATRGGAAVADKAAAVVEAAPVGAAVEAAAMAEAVEAAEAMRVQAAIEAVVWGTVETAVRAARGPEIVIEEQSEQGCGGDTDEGAQEMARGRSGGNG